MSRFRNDYAPDGQQKRREARERAGHRCVRCGHPFETGKHGSGEWSPCDERCEHKGPIQQLCNDGTWLAIVSSATAGWIVRDGYKVQAQWRVLTTHHLDGDKANDAWWNTLALCQRCHLTIQGKVIPEIPYFLEHAEWFKPFVAGFYAFKYEGRMIEREEAERRLDELLAYEMRTA